MKKFQLLFCFAVLLSFLSSQKVVYSQEKKYEPGLVFEFRHPLITSPFDLQDFDKIKPKFPVGLLALGDSVSYQRQIEYQIFISTYSKRNIKIDSTQTYVLITEKIDDKIIRLPCVMDYQTYKTLYAERNKKIQIAKTFKEQFNKPLQYGNQGVEITIPIRLKNKALLTIFGGERVSVQATGNTEISIGASRTKSSNSALSQNDKSVSFDPEVEASNRYNIKGKIGEKLEISVNVQDAQDFTNQDNVRLTYTGFEDDIIQKIEAGNTSLQLKAGTTLITGTGSGSSNLFGIKMVNKIGEVELTSILSLEKSQRQKKSLKGGSTVDSLTVSDYGYIQGKFFFVDSPYLNQYDNLQMEKNSGTISIPAGSQIKKIEVYKSKDIIDISGTGRVGEKVQLFTNPNDSKTLTNEKARWFTRLESNEYTVNSSLGIINLTTAISENEILAVSYQTENGTQVGDFLETAGEFLNLRILKPKRNVTPSDALYYDLSLKNVYFIGTTGITAGDFTEFEKNFDLTIYQSALPEGNKLGNNPTVAGIPLIKIFKLDENSNNKVDLTNTSIFRLNEGYLFFPRLRPFKYENISQELRNQISSVFSATDVEKLQEANLIYEELNTNKIADHSVYTIVVKSKNLKAGGNVSSTISLGGINVLEGSEVITSNGQKLIKGKDYDLDYFLGELTLKSSEFLSEGRDLVIEYESADLFSFEKKALYGVTAFYSPVDNTKTKLQFAGTALWLSQTSTDQKPRIGREPVKNLVWGFSSDYNLKEINWLTKAVDAIPLVDTKAPSSFTLQAEFAQSIPNPNTHNDTSTNDNNGVAYIDDFEGTEKSNSVSLKPPFWQKSSVPDGFELKDRKELFWYEGQVPITDILNKDVASGSDQQNILRMVYIHKDSTDSPLRKGWAGMTQSSSVFSNQLDSKFIEIWIRNINPNARNSGRIHLDIGKISEDVNGNSNVTNGFPDTEDKPQQNLLTGDGILQDSEDTGLDKCFDAYEDGFGNCIEDSAIARQIRESYGISSNDPNKDNYKSGSGEELFTYRYSNNLEGNSKSNIAEYNKPDSEDLDGDYSLNLENNYLSYTIDLASEVKNFVGNGAKISKGWKLYRIPLEDYDKLVGNQTAEDILSDIRFMKIWVDEGGFNGEYLTSQIGNETINYSVLDIAFLDFVGYEWQELSLIPNSTPPVTKLKIKTVNTDKNPEYVPPPGVGQETDKASDVKLREQSLAIDIENLQPNEIFWIEKRLRGDSGSQGLDLSNYEVLKMFVHGNGFGKDSTSYFGNQKLDLPNLNIVFRLTQNSNPDFYYEIEQPIFPANFSNSSDLVWQPEKNNLDVDFKDFTTLKSSFTNFTSASYKDSTVFVTTESGEILPRKFAFQGNIPTITRVGRIQIGFRNVSKSEIKFAQVWINELRVSNVNRDKGLAYRVNADLKFADFLNVNGGYTFKDQEFRQIQDKKGSNFNSQDYRINSTLQLGKFFPNKFGVSVPFTSQYSYSHRTPKYVAENTTDILYNSAIEVAGSNPDKVLADSLKQSLVDRSVSTSKDFSFSTSYSKSPSRNKYLNYTLDPLKITNVTYKVSDKVNPTELKNIQKTYSGGLDYSLNFPVLDFKPLFWFPQKSVKEVGFSYFPSKLDFGTSGSKVVTERQLRSSKEPDPTNKTFILSRSYGGEYLPFSILRLTIDREERFDALADSTRKIGFSEIIKLDYGEREFTKQTTSVNLTPKIADLSIGKWKFLAWTINPTLAASSNFTFNRYLKRDLQDVEISNDRSYSANIQFNLQTFFRTFTFYDPEKANAGNPASKDGTKQPKTLRDLNAESQLEKLDGEVSKEDILEFSNEKETSDVVEDENSNEEFSKAEAQDEKKLPDEEVSKLEMPGDEDENSKADSLKVKKPFFQLPEFKMPKLTIWTIPNTIYGVLGIIEPLKVRVAQTIGRKDYGYSSDQLNKSGLPSLDYQFGFTGGYFSENAGQNFTEPKGDFTYDTPDSNFINTGTVLGRTVTNDYNYASGFRLGQVNFTFDYGKKESNAEGFTIEDTSGASFLKYDPSVYRKIKEENYTALDFGLLTIRQPFVNWRIDWSGWEKHFNLNKYFNSIALANVYSSRITESFQQRTDFINSDTLKLSKDSFTITSNFSPLFGVTASLKGGFTFNLDFNLSKTRKSTGTGKSGSFDQTEEWQSSVSYTRQTGFRIPRWFYLLWWIRGRSFNNSMTTSFSLTRTVTESKKGAEGIEFHTVDSLFDEKNFKGASSKSNVLTASTKVTYNVNQRFTSGATLDYNNQSSKNESSPNNSVSTWKFWLNFKINI
ncbi:cell surface protein SprA [bacterium]|nr:cell surface protein SprA [bacterium]